MHAPALDIQNSKAADRIRPFRSVQHHIIYSKKEYILEIQAVQGADTWLVCPASVWLVTIWLVTCQGVMVMPLITP